MALFKRDTLREKELTEDQVDYIMTEAGRALAADYIPKSDVQARIDAALEEARKAAPVQVKVQDSEEYKALAAELAKTKALATEDFAAVKPKFRESVWGMLDHEKPVAEQLPEIQKQYEEYFVKQEAAEGPGKPTFGSQDKGAMPKGAEGKSLGDLWGFHK